MVRELRALAEMAVRRFEDAAQAAGLPPMPSVSAGRITITPHGVHIHLGGCNPRTLVAYADWIKAHARCAGRIVTADTVPTGLAQLPVLQCELRCSDE